MISKGSAIRKVKSEGLSQMHITKLSHFWDLHDEQLGSDWLIPIFCQTLKDHSPELYEKSFPVPHFPPHWKKILKCWCSLPSNFLYTTHYFSYNMGFV